MTATNTALEIPSLDTVARILRSLVHIEVARRRLHVCEHDKDDLVQELLVSAWQRDLPRFDATRGTLRGFLRTRVRWSLVDMLRVSDRERARFIDDAFDDDAHEPAAPEADPEAQIDAHCRELRLLSFDRDVRDAIDAIDDEKALFAIVAHDLHEQPLRTVAQTLGIHPANATRARQRGLQHLRVVLDEGYRAAA
jgi:RNA polymerase sigma factor (sigma-70 family)